VARASKIRKRASQFSLKLTKDEKMLDIYKGVFGRAPRNSRFKKSTPLQKMSAKHNQLQQLHRESAQKTVE
jgi:hypothetical protein